VHLPTVLTRPSPGLPRPRWKEQIANLAVKITCDGLMQQTPWGSVGLACMTCLQLDSNNDGFANLAVDRSSGWES
jgi:hypothetical protein